MCVLPPVSCLHYSGASPEQQDSHRKSHPVSPSSPPRGPANKSQSLSLPAAWQQPYREKKVGEETRQVAASLARCSQACFPAI